MNPFLLLLITAVGAFALHLVMVVALVGKKK